MQRFKKDWVYLFIIFENKSELVVLLGNKGTLILKEQVVFIDNVIISLNIK